MPAWLAFAAKLRAGHLGLLAAAQTPTQAAPEYNDYVSAGFAQLVPPSRW